MFIFTALDTAKCSHINSTPGCYGNVFIHGYLTVLEEVLTSKLFKKVNDLFSYNTPPIDHCRL